MLFFVRSEQLLNTDFGEEDIESLITSTISSVLLATLVKVKWDPTKLGQALIGAINYDR